MSVVYKDYFWKNFITKAFSLPGGIKVSHNSLLPNISWYELSAINECRPAQVRDIHYLKGF